MTCDANKNKGFKLLPSVFVFVHQAGETVLLYRFGLVAGMNKNYPYATKNCFSQRGGIVPSHPHSMNVRDFEQSACSFVTLDVLFFMNICLKIFAICEYSCDIGSFMKTICKHFGERSKSSSA